MRTKGLEEWNSKVVAGWNTSEKFTRTWCICIGQSGFQDKPNCSNPISYGNAEGVSETMFNLSDGYAGDVYCYFNRHYLILKFNECQCVLEGRFDCPADRVEPCYFAPRFPIFYRRQYILYIYVYKKKKNPFILKTWHIASSYINHHLLKKK